MNYTEFPPKNYHEGIWIIDIPNDDSISMEEAQILAKNVADAFQKALESEVLYDAEEALEEFKDDLCILRKVDDRMGLIEKILDVAFGHIGTALSAQDTCLGRVLMGKESIME